MRLFKTFLQCIIFTLFAGCNSTLEDPDSPDPTKILLVSCTESSIPSGGITTRVIARLPLLAGVTDVTFTTTAGNFIQVGAKTIKQLADSLTSDYRYAAVTLASDATTKGIVYITVEAKSARTRTSITFY